jgi:hypothetical protein
MPEATRISSLKIHPIAGGVSATIGLTGFAYAGDGSEIALPAAQEPDPAAAMTAAEAPR